MTDPSRPSYIIASDDVPEEPGRYPGSDEVLAHGRPVGRVAGLLRIGLHVERLEPGHRLSYPHAEEAEEEFVYVLDGEVDAWIDGVLHPMRAGDLAAFPAGTGVAHTFLNRGAREARLLVGGEASRRDSRIYYPLNPERRAEIGADQWWDEVPARALGPHDGRASGG
ncbi:MAG: Hemolysin [Myxococcaceae bacterium]|nr:Hemolysin [Myxococcaceae bacterium]